MPAEITPHRRAKCPSDMKAPQPDDESVCVARWTPELGRALMVAKPEFFGCPIKSSSATAATCQMMSHIR